jgi:Mn-dependent DtxR family transcriptional regulator
MSNWTFISNHGVVLILTNRYGQITTRAIAEALGIIERSVIRIINDLERGEYIKKIRVTRVNHYEINREAQLRHKGVRDVAVDDFLEVLSAEE